MAPERGDHGAWAPERTGDGSWTLRHPVHGEACHSLAGAWTEARERYAGPCRLRERAARRAPGAVLRLLDVGTGLGTNLAAALEALTGTGVRLQAWTLEHDPSVLRAACALAEDDARAGGLVPVQRRVLAALGQALGAGGGTRSVPHAGTEHHVTLVLGDARRTLHSLAAGLCFDAVFLDPFSPAREPELWRDGFLSAVARRMAAGSWLSTYSAAVAVRRGLVRAGLRVGRGPRVGAKAEGTLASPDRDPPPLAPRLARRLLRAAGEGQMLESGGPCASRP